MFFRELLRNHRITLGLTQRRLAEIVGMDPSHLSRIESGRKNPPKRAAVEKLSQALQLNDESRHNFFNAAGYVPSSLSNAIGFSSPLKDEISPVKLSLIKKIGYLKPEAVKVVEEVVTLLLFDDPSSGVASNLAKQIRLFIRTLNDLIPILKREGFIKNGHGKGSD